MTLNKLNLWGSTSVYVNGIVCYFGHMPV